MSERWAAVPPELRKLRRWVLWRSEVLSDSGLAAAVIYFHSFCAVADFLRFEGLDGCVGIIVPLYLEVGRVVVGLEII